MALKPQSERKTAHRIFKFFKARNEFPPDKTPLESYRLLAKYNYFIAKDLDKKTINILTEICNILDREKVLICYGDFMLETLQFGLNSFKYNKDTKTKLIYIDAITDKPEDSIATSSITSSLFNSYIIYIIDNIDMLNKKSVKFLMEIQDRIYTSNKSIICCTMLLNKVDLQLKNKYKKIQLGKYSSDKLTLKYFVYLLFNEVNRDKVISIFKQNKMPNAYFLGLISYNLHSFYSSDAELHHNMEILEKTNSMLYKVSNQLLLNYFVNLFQTTTIKRAIRFPSKINKKRNITVKKSKLKNLTNLGNKKINNRKSITNSKKSDSKTKKMSVLQY